MPVIDNLAAGILLKFDVSPSFCMQARKQLAQYIIASESCMAIKESDYKNTGQLCDQDGWMDGYISP